MIELQFKLVGGGLIVLAMVHVVFPRRFNWKEELRLLSTINREMMYVHTFFIALTLFLMGVLCITSASELTQTTFGKRISLGLGLFWIIRLFFQFFVYSVENWKGKRFETGVHIGFIILWAYLGTLFILAYFV